MTDPTTLDPTSGTTLDQTAEAVSYTWVPTADEQHTIDSVREYAGIANTGPSPLHALDFADELHAEQQHASLEAAAQGDLVNGWAVFDLDQGDHSPTADAARAELAALDVDLAADHALGLDDGPDLADDLGL
jgi:hypothetical protein